MDYITNYKFDSQISWLFQRRLLPLVRNKKMLDMGCGQGDYLQFSSRDSLGLDIAPANISIARKKGFNVKQFDLNRPGSIKEEFEVVFMSHVLEHVDCPINLLRFANQVLKVKGAVIISIPNEQSFIHLKYPYFRGDGNHLYSFSINNMVELLNASGFEPPEVHYDFYTNLTGRLGLNPFLQALNLLPNFIKNPFAWAYWFVAFKR